MKRRLSALCGTLLLQCLGVFCTIYALITAFDFSVDHAILAGICLVGVLISGVCSTVWGIKGVLPALMAALLVFALVLPSVAAGGRAVLSVLTAELGPYLPLPHLFPGARATPQELSLLFGSAGVLLGSALSLAVTARRSVLPTVLVTLPPAALAFSIIPLPPAAWCAVGLLLLYLLLLLRDALAPDPRTRGFSTVLPALALVGLVLTAGYFIAPPSDFAPERWSVLVEDTLRAQMPRLKPLLDQFDGDILPINPLNLWYYNTEETPIADAGARTLRHQTILTVTTDTPGNYYLRGHSLAQFDGRSWQKSTSVHFATLYAAQFPAALLRTHSITQDDEQPRLTMTVNNRSDLSGMLYLPYYTDFATITADSTAYPPVWADDGYLPGMAQTYSVDFYHPTDSLPNLAAASPNGWVNFMPDGSNYAGHVYAVYTPLDDSTAEGLRALAEQAGIDPTADRQTIAAQVAAYVMSAARYDLRPSPVPEGEDFALYFLTESRRGYCIHFTTAAALMLRALDVPARFASGFRATVPARLAGQDAPVTDADAHAWVEVYYDDIGWVPLEVTPSYASTAGTVADAYVPPEDVPPPRPTAGTAQTPSATTPSAQTPTQTAPSRSALPRAVIIAVCLLTAAVLLAVLGRRLAQHRRSVRFAAPGTNAAVLYAYAYLRHLLGGRTPPPEALEALALKARFSHHTLTEAERAVMVDYAVALSQTIDARLGFFGKLRFRYLRLLY